MRIHILLFVFLLFGGVSQAQNIDVKGTVTDGTYGGPLGGVNILIKNTTKGIQTDFDGNFVLYEVPKGAILVFSYLGYQTKEVVANEATLNVTMTEDVTGLDEVVLIGYGKQQKKDVTGAVALVGEETLATLRPVDATTALQGTTAGVAVNVASGAPGANVNILVRGISSNTNNNPLVIVDGYEGDLNSINPNDIESITVLKDAQAAIYGVRGGNGVVLVTTKVGKKNMAPTVSYDVFTALQQTARKLNYLNATEYAAILNESYAANGEDLPFSNIRDLGEGTDWQDELFANALMQNHNLSVKGGGENFQYFVSGSRVEQDGIVAPDYSNFVKSNVKANIGIDINEKLKFSFIAGYTALENQGFASTLLFNGLNYAPTFATNQDDLDNFLGIELINPLTQLDNTFGETKGNVFEGNFKLDYKLLENLNITSRVGYKIFNNKERSFTPIQYHGRSKVYNKTQSSVYQKKETSTRVQWETFATYDKTFAEDHNTTFVLGASVQNDLFDGIYVTGFDVPNNDYAFADISLTDRQHPQRSLNTGSDDLRLTSFFGRAQYDYKGKYLLSGLIRRDAVSSFSDDLRVDYFWSFTSGWKISEEDFMKDSEVISFMKLRASYGTLGNFVGNNLHKSLLSGQATYVFDGELVDGRAQGRLPNPLAQWETAKKLDIGLDVNFLDDRLRFVTDFFIETREDLLIDNFPVSGILGTKSPGGRNPTVNAGTSENTGAELGINYKVFDTEDLTMDLSYNVTYVENEVTEVLGGTFLEGGSFAIGNLPISRMEVGFPIGYFYGLQTNGIFQNQEEIDAHPSQDDLGAATAPGDFRYVDTNKDGKIDFNDRVEIGNPQADFFMGLQASVNYKNWDFSTYLYAELGKEMVRNFERFLPNSNKPNYYLGRWKGEGTSNEIPRVTTAATNNKLFSDFYVEDASFLRMQNIQVGYTFPTDLMQKVSLTKARLYVAANNLFTLTKYTGYDPTINNGAIGAGIDSGFYPSARQFILGLNVTF
ncbi:MAG: TonB-dependent receptor [Flavobacteriaceae bacterium]|nr:TonB-dependent receptor [Flavobacteriaceae bacterium]